MTPTDFAFSCVGLTGACRAGVAATEGRRDQAAAALPGGVGGAWRKALTCADERLTRQKRSGSLRYRKSINVLLTAPGQEVS
jgi:hypothetical protein